MDLSRAPVDQLKELPEFNAGDTIDVHYRVKEGDKERVQIFRGVVTRKRGSGLNATFTVRKISAGVGVERIFPSHSPNIINVERIRQGDVRRANLNFLRNLRGKAARIKEKDTYTS